MIVGESTLSEYASYLALEDVLQAQRPRSAAHDEMLFIVVHQVHELWFKLLLHEFSRLQLHLSRCETAHALQTLRRSLSILRVVVSPMDVLETLTPRQFSGFRPALGSGSGFQSAQFREIEAVLGRRDRRMYEYFGEGSDERARIEAAMNRPSMYDSLLRFLALNGYPVPGDWLHRDVSQPLLPATELQNVLLRVYRDDGVAAQICELLVEVDQGVQEWRYRHVSLVSRMIGDKRGTGGSSGASYLRSTLFRPVFPDLWAVRGAL
ncbi:MAG TPA: tryptophan 2,3-dioxygenase family protein [Streptosporangiaceae bacterium]